MPEPADFPILITRKDRETPIRAKPLPIVIVLDRLRSAFNTGNIFRLAEAVRATKIIGCGTTPMPPHPKLAKTARGCDTRVPCEAVSDCREAILRLRRNGCRVYGVETVESAPAVWEATIEFPAAFVFGNEALGIQPQTLALCDACIGLPMLGRKNSINVANCAAVVLYDALRRLSSGKTAPAPPAAETAGPL